MRSLRPGGFWLRLTVFWVIAALMFSLLAMSSSLMETVRYTESSPVLAIEDSRVVLENKNIRAVFDLDHSSMAEFCDLRSDPTLNLIRWGTSREELHWSGFQEFFATEDWPVDDGYIAVAYFDPDGMTYELLSQTPERLVVKFTDIEMANGTDARGPSIRFAWIVEVGTSADLVITRHLEVSSSVQAGEQHLRMTFVNGYSAWFINEEEHGLLTGNSQAVLYQVHETHQFWLKDTEEDVGDVRVLIHDPGQYDQFSFVQEQDMDWIVFCPTLYRNREIMMGERVLDALSITTPGFPPAADAGPNIVTFEDRIVEFDGSGSTDDERIASYGWSFGDDEHHSSSDPNVSHEYTAPGTYIVTLEVCDEEGLCDSDYASVRVKNLPPLANAGEDVTAHQFEKITFDASGSIDTPTDRDGLIFIWYFGDGETAANEVVTHAYRRQGNYTATLVVIDDDGATSSDSREVIVTEVEVSKEAAVNPFHIIGYIMIVAIVLLIIDTIVRVLRRGENSPGSDTEGE